jgi:magnesium and cobalt exporter, CNNM family
MTTDYIWLEPILIFFLILANGFFAASEIAMIAMRKSRIDALLERGVRSAAVVARLKADPDRFLATVQIGVTVISTFASAIGGAAASGYLKPQIAALPFSFAARWAEAIALLIVVLPSWCRSLLPFDIRSRSPALSLVRSILSPGSALFS